MNGRREEALHEYYWIQDRLVQYEARRYQVKSWSITASGVAFATAILERAPGLLLIAAGGALIFWYIEASLRLRQSVGAERARKLEKTLQGKGPRFTGPAFFQHRQQNTDGVLKAFFRAALFPTVYLPHALIALFGIYLFIDSQRLAWTKIWFLLTAG